MATFVTVTRENGEAVDLNLDAVAYVLRDRKGNGRVFLGSDDANFLAFTAEEMKQLVPDVVRLKEPAPVRLPRVETAIF